MTFLRGFFIRSKQVLHLLIQYPCGDKEEVENWRQRTRHPSVPLKYPQPALKLASYIDRVFDLFINSFPLAYPSPDSSGLCPSVAESMPSVPPISQSVLTTEGICSKIPVPMALLYSFTLHLSMAQLEKALLTLLFVVFLRTYIQNSQHSYTKKSSLG